MSTVAASPAPWRVESVPGSPAHALASAHPGSRYRITGVLFDLVRECCHGMGLAHGDEITCVDREVDAVMLERADGRRVQLDRGYAWFVQVRQLEGPAGSHIRE